METTFTRLLGQEACRIGDELLAQAETDAQGLSWKTIHQQGDKITWQKSESIYNGVCGIILFLAELYGQTHDPKYLHAAREGARWVEWYCQTQPATSYAFLTGRMSVPYTLLQLYRHTHQPEYLEKALIITQDGLATWEPPLMEFINGAAGTLLCLLHLHAATRQPWLLGYIATYTNRLLRHAHLSKKGLYWDRAPVNIHGLCGLSHGAAGVGLVWLELGQYFNHPAYYWLAEQAFNYESQYYSPEMNNWYDLRKMVVTPQEEQERQEAYATGDYHFFTRAGNMNAWCHGAAGIGLVRLRAAELLQKPLYATQARQALDHTWALSQPAGTPTHTYTLCHGGCGNAELFLQAYLLHGEPAYQQMAATVAQNAILDRATTGYYRSGTKYTGPDTSLFMGNAGIGYFYLRLLQPRQVPSILLPSLPAGLAPAAAAPPAIRYSVGDLQRQLISRVFPGTLQLLQTQRPQMVATYFRQPTSAADPAPSFLDVFVQAAKAQVAALPPRQSHLLYESLLVEWLQMQVNEDITSDALLAYKNDQKARRAAVLSTQSFAVLRSTRLQVDPDMQMLHTAYACPQLAAAHKTPTDQEHTILLLPGLAYTQVQKLSAFSAAVLAPFAEEITVAAALQHITRQFEELEPSQLTTVENLVLAQIQQAIRAGILLEPHQHPLPVLARPALVTP